MSLPFEIKPDTTYVITTDSELTVDQAERIIEVWRDTVPETTNLLVIDRGLSLSELSDDLLRLAGLRRV